MDIRRVSPAGKIVAITGVTGGSLFIAEVIAASETAILGAYIGVALISLGIIAYAIIRIWAGIAEVLAESRTKRERIRHEKDFLQFNHNGDTWLYHPGSATFLNTEMLPNGVITPLSMSSELASDPTANKRWAARQALKYGQRPNFNPFANGPVSGSGLNPNYTPGVLEAPGAIPIQDMGQNAEVSTVNKILERTQSVRICGSTGLGKTNLANQVIEGLYQKYGYVYVVNIHADPGTYPDYVQVVGQNLNHAEAKTFLQKLVHICKERYRNEKPNQPEFHQAIPVVIEEVETFHTVVSDVWPEFMEAVSINFRKISIRVIMIAQSDAVGTWGVKNRKSMLTGLDLVKFGIEAGDHYNLYTEAGGAGESRTKTALVKVPGYENYDIDSFSFDGDLMPDMVELDIDQGPQTSEQKIIDYISRSGGAVTRGRLTISRCLGKTAKSAEYDAVLNPLLESGRVRLQSTGATKAWIYTV